MILTLTPKEAEGYFMHPTQIKGSMIVDGASLPDGAEYRAMDGVCGAFHECGMVDIWMVHFAVLPEAWGKCVPACKAIVEAFAREVGAKRLIGWTPEHNRAALSLVRRVGFEIDGRLPLDEPFIMSGWSP
jgi:RimJ/RimL family protein N-acetyltransferase